MKAQARIEKENAVQQAPVAEAAKQNDDEEMVESTELQELVERNIRA